MTLLETIQSWLANAFPRWRVTPTEDQVSDFQKDLCATFQTVSGQRVLHAWIEWNNFQSPRSHDPYEVMAWQGKCAFVEDIVKALDKANSPAKYEPQDIMPGKVMYARR